MPAYKQGKRWRYRFTLDGRRYGGSTPIANNTMKAAETLERAKADQVMARRYSGVMPTVKEFAPRFLEYQEQHTKQLTFDLHTTIVNLHIVPHLGKLRLDGVRRAELDSLKAAWSCAPRTANTRLGVAMRMLAIAAEWEIIEVAPKTKLLKIAADHPRFLTEQEAAALIAAAKPNWRSMVMVALRTGLRIGELRGLQWGDVDLTGRLLRVRRTDPGRPDMDPNAPKGNRPRVVPLTPDTLACLRELYEATPAEHRKAKSWVWIGAASWHGQHDRYRTRSEGNCAMAMGTIAARAKLDEEVTWHTLRHTYASWLVMRAVPLSAVQELLGHASIRQTERYAHLAPGFAQHAAVAAALDFPLVSVAAILPELPAATPALPAGDSKRSRRRARNQHATNGRSPSPRKPRRDP